MFAQKGYLFSLVLACAVSLTSCSKPEDRVIGAWDFRTDVMRRASDGNPYYLEGSLFVTRRGDGVDCSLQTKEIAVVLRAGFKLGEIQATTAQQSCQVIVSDHNLSIQSQVTKSSSGSYEPDNFNLKVEGDAMSGHLISLVNLPVSFVRRGSSAQLPVVRNFAAGKTFSGQAKGWISLGESTDNCKVSYQSPIDPAAETASFRVWLRYKCAGETSGGLRYSYYETRKYIDCIQKKSYWEMTAYYQKDGSTVEDAYPKYYGLKVDGTFMKSEGIGGEIMRTNSFDRMVSDKICA